MAQHVVFIDRIAVKPVPHDGTVDAVVVTPAFIARVVWGVDENAIHLSGVIRQQRLERHKVISVNDETSG